MAREVKVGLCRGCGGHDQCHYKAEVEDGRLIRTMNFPESPFSPYFTAEGCPKNRAWVELSEHPGRLDYPLKRAGARGENKWERVGWDQALDEIATKLDQIRKESGPEYVGAIIGFWNEEWDIGRFFNAFGSGNVENINARVCSGQEAFMNLVMFGGITHYGPPTPACKLTVCWSGSHHITGGLKWKAMMRVPKLIVVDPIATYEAKRADVFCQLRPGTDTALALGWLNVIINENLYDKEFVEEWVLGFEELKGRVREFPPERVEEITWVPRQTIVDAATLYATTKPANIQWGTACAQLGRNAAESERARNCLRAITGNVDKDGGNHFIRAHPKLYSFKKLLADELLPQSQVEKIIGAENAPVMSRKGYELLHDKESQRAFAIRGPNYPSLVNALLTGKPYRPRAVFVAGCNPLVTVSQTGNIYKAFKEHIEFSVSLELWQTPTSMLCDYVLPVTSWLERPTVNFLEQANCIMAGERILPKSIPGKYDRRDDYDVWRELGLRLGQKDLWPWETLDEVMDMRVKELGMPFQKFARKKSWDIDPLEFETYKKVGFKTPSGKIELTSTIFEKCGLDPVVHYEEPSESPVSTPELSKQYPYILMNPHKPKMFLHSSFRGLKSLRRKHNEPFVRIHPDTALKHGISEGDMVWIETPRGRIQQKAVLTPDILPQCIAPDPNWWFPEKEAKEPSLFGAFEKSFNFLTSDSIEHAGESCGNWYLGGMLCKVYRVKDGEEIITPTYEVPNYDPITKTPII